MQRRPYGGDLHEFFANTRRFPGRATPHHLISICDVNLCPASEPLPLPAGTPYLPPPVSGDGGDGGGDGGGVSIRVVDTGFIDDVKNAAEAAHETIFEHVSGEARKTFTVEGLIRLYAGHGTFIGGTIGAVAPKAEVVVANKMTWAGAVWEFDLGPGLSSALAEHPDIISLSAGGTTLDNREYLGLAQFLDDLARDGHTLLVAAVGNEGGPNLLMPAGAAGGHQHVRDDIVSVGALREDLKGMACFSNYGPGVKVYAPGERLIGAFPTGEYEYVEPPSATCRYHHPALYDGCTCVSTPLVGERKRFDGRARWSGTSFSTPIVAAMTAAHLSKHRDRFKNPRDAFTDLLASEGVEFNLDGRSPAGLGTGTALVPRSMRP